VVRFLTIGTYAETTLRMAYEAHAELIKQLNRGEEPSLKHRCLINTRAGSSPAPAGKHAHASSSFSCTDGCV
jgi:hypothetical protein